MNADWHRAHVMPKNATLDQRVAWHVEHAEACACREMPRAVVEELERRRREAPQQQAHHQQAQQQ